MMVEETQSGVMHLRQEHIDALDQAEALLFHFDFCPYFELRSLFRSDHPTARDRFRALFTKYYGLNTGGLTGEFLDRFFAILFEGNVIVGGRPAFSAILMELCAIKRRRGDCAMPFSFVSKLVAMHDEASPVYDRHVLAFFNGKAPPASTEKSKRIEWFERLLQRISASYTIWSSDTRMSPVLERFKRRDEKLADLHPVRLMDFLIWKVGNAGLLAKMTGAM